MNKHRFNQAERAGVYKAIAERRDMRHFLPDAIDSETLYRLYQAAHQAGSVGLMQPWRFIRVTDQLLREKISQLVETEKKLTAQALADKQKTFMQLKIAGILECSELVVVALKDQREQHIFGRRTLPEMDLASTACAIQNMWLAARAEGIGMGWVSFFDPDELANLLNMPTGSKAIAILCLGYVKTFYPRPLLEIENWTQAEPLEAFISENTW